MFVDTSPQHGHRIATALRTALQAHGTVRSLTEDGEYYKVEGWIEFNATVTPHRSTRDCLAAWAAGAGRAWVAPPGKNFAIFDRRRDPDARLLHERLQWASIDYEEAITLPAFDLGDQVLYPPFQPGTVVGIACPDPDDPEAYWAYLIQPDWSTNLESSLSFRADELEPR
ncbi:hypothetical protein JK358_35935 [Nocardia sp. 2]|uniref:Uncharacterized protein n=1 Tax=Nocardia acididurans TaxID=2802282 RepID=A0ABS1MGW8_9NOCA|nr:hypothetical protein [Nocardia acididurans]MBL1079807.1 hypothetical protein [Nocardia acididurans]